MPKTIYFIRHGESEANVKGIYQGQTFDSALTENGRRQAETVARFMAALQAKAIYTSPLKRAYQTAAAIASEMKLPFDTDKRLVEIHHGTWEGKTIHQFSVRERLLLKQWQVAPAQVRMIGGEAINEVAQRCLEFIESLPNGPVIVVTHDVLIRVAVTSVIEHGYNHMWRYTLDNCGVTTLTFDPRRLINLNQNWHLNGLKSSLHRQAW